MSVKAKKLTLGELLEIEERANCDLRLLAHLTWQSEEIHLLKESIQLVRGTSHKYISQNHCQECRNHYSRQYYLKRKEEDALSLKRLDEQTAARTSAIEDFKDFRE